MGCPEHSLGDELLLAGIGPRGWVRGQLAASTAVLPSCSGPLRLVLVSPSQNGDSSSESVLDRVPGSSRSKVAGPGLRCCLTSFSQLHSVVSLLCPGSSRP